MSFFPTAQRPSHLVEFNAGKCIRDGNTLKPDPRKGTIYMDQSDDQLMHFYWKERKATAPEDDLIIFPDEAEMIPVEECTTGRVYLLKFKSSSQKLFFWMQRKDSDMDEEWINKVNQLINDPQSAMEEGRHSDRGLGFPSDSQDLMQMLGDNGRDIGMSEENLVQFLQAAGGFGGTVPAPSRLGGDGPIDSTMELDEDTDQQERSDKRLSPAQIESLRDAIADVMVTSEQGDTQIHLSDVDTSSAAFSLLWQDTELRSALFPDVDAISPLEQLNPGFQASLQKIRKALDNSSLDSILAFLGLDASTNVNTFLKAMEEQAELRHGGDHMEDQ